MIIPSHLGRALPSALIVCATMSCAVLITHAEGLPKISVAADGRTFVSAGRPFVPMGVNYYRPGTGWAPQVWKQFDPEATQRDFARMKALGVNCVRVFLTYGSFYQKAGKLNEEGLAKFDRLLEIAEQAGIYVHPTGPDHWEGMPQWGPVAIEEEATLAALESFWSLFASRYQNRNVLFAYDLKNEPELAWHSATLQTKWNDWVRQTYTKGEDAQRAWDLAEPVDLAKAPVPSDKDARGSQHLLDYQRFRESVADEWTRRQVATIRKADAKALVTVGLIQWSVPAVLSGSVKYYSAFRPERQARFLDFMEIHFYPLAQGAFEYRDAAQLNANLAYAESVVREVALCGKPVVVAEFGWYGGGKPTFDGGRHPAATEEQHAEYCRKLVETTAGLATGWLNWGLYDQPEASDCSQLTGLLTANGKMKVWGQEFQKLATKYAASKMAPKTLGTRPRLDWDACLTSVTAQRDFLAAYRNEFIKENSASR